MTAFSRSDVGAAVERLAQEVRDEMAAEGSPAPSPVAVIRQADSQLRDRVMAAIAEWTHAVGAAPSRVEVVMSPITALGDAGPRYVCADVRTTLES